MFCGYCGKKIDDRAMFCPFCGKPTQAPANTPGPDPVPYTGGKGLKSDDSDLYHDVNRGSAAQPGPVPVPPRPSGEKPGLKIDLSGLKNIKFPSMGALSDPGTANIINLVSMCTAIAGSVILILSGFLPFLKLTEDWQRYTGWFYDVNEATVKMTSKDVIPFWIAMTVFCIMVIVAAVIKQKLLQIIGTVLDLLVCLVFAGVMADYMDDYTTSMIYDYGIGRVFFVLGLILLIVSLIVTIVSIAAKQNIPAGRPVNRPMNRPVYGPAGGPVNNPMYGPAGGPANGPMYGPANGPAGGPMYGPANGPANGPMYGPANGPVNNPMYGHAGGPANAPSNGPVYGPADSPVNSPVGGPADGPGDLSGSR